jgi:hypothetical protein
MRPPSCLPIGLAVLAWLAGAAGARAQDELPEEREIQREVAAVAEKFIDALLLKDASLLSGLGTDPFTFDGRVVRDRVAIMRRWKTYLEGPAGKLSDQPGIEMNVFSYNKAVSLYGPPPAKLSHLKLDKCRFATLTFAKRDGFMLILTPNPAVQSKIPAETALQAQAPPRWLVTAVTE